MLCLVRATRPAEARARVRQALQPWLPEVERLLETGRLAVLRGDIGAPAAGVGCESENALRGRVVSLVHAAASTRFETDAAGDPARTNVHGLAEILQLAGRLACRDWHLISTAFVAAPQRNAYESSKLQGERIAVRSARELGATLTIYRPSIVVGHSRTGYAARFSGIYHLFRATSLLAREAKQQGQARAVRLRIAAPPGGRPNLICVDDVAGAFATLYSEPAARGGIYELTHPEPPSNSAIKEVLEAHYGICGGSFAETESVRCRGPVAELQALFEHASAPIRHYFDDARHFSRVATERFVHKPPSPWTRERLLTLLAFAERAGWRSHRALPDERRDPSLIARYFQEFLPQAFARVHVGRMRQPSVRVQFSVGAQCEGQWTLDIRRGRMHVVSPGDDRPADVTYQTSETHFWAAVAGTVSGPELFLSDEAQVGGDIERALKLARILADVVDRYPYHPNAETRFGGD